MKQTKSINLPHAGTKVRPIEYAGYFAGMIGYQLPNTLISIYLLMYMTNVMQIPTLYAGSVTLICRFVDAFTDIFFGTIGDRTHTRFGSFRPWYITLAIPTGLCFAVLFICPGFVTPGSMFALFWIYFIYLLYGSVCNTILFTSYGAFTNVVTSDPAERNKMVVARQAGMNISNVAVSAATPIMMYFGGGVSNNAAAFTALGVFVGAVAIVCCIFCGLVIRERVPLNKGKAVPIRESFKVFRGNKLFLGVLIANVFHSIAMSMFAALTSYFFLYYKMNPGLMSKTQLAAGIINTVISLLVLPILMRKLKKTTTYLIASVAWIGLSVLGYFTAAINIGGYLLTLGSGLGLMIAYAVVYSLIPDAVDYGEWRSGVSAPGTVNTVLTFIQKVTTGFGTMLTSVLITIVGFDSTLGFAQTPATQEGLRVLICVVPSAFFLISMIGMFFFRPKGLDMKRVREELKAKRLAEAENAAVGAAERE